MQCKAYAYTCDVSNENQVEELADKVFREVGDVDILINNAGVLPGKPLLELTNKQIKKTLDINTLAHMWLSRRENRCMLSPDSLISHASLAGFIAPYLRVPHRINYQSARIFPAVMMDNEFS
ncbi:epidermal retinol dehydrogenase 2 [Trichonephila inaurata madagascariensis]|uniref:Epidermal retinol dehydrogenase 2 n=1 Tax=Trichonephila inaurata madagascariensis TaxID=2747483 RepID=A0A8X6WYD7_9ARAC|nr:epidermal retinol dehydrogenase 2 [Trichonephila inaurata madagascariensis]